MYASASMKMIAMKSMKSMKLETFMQVWNMPELKEYIYAYDPTYKNRFNQCLDELQIKIGQRNSMNQFKHCIQELPIIAERYSIYTILKVLVGTVFPSTLVDRSCSIINWDGEGIISRDDEWVLGNFTAQSIKVKCNIYNMINDDPDSTEVYEYEAIFSGIRYDQETKSFKYDDIKHFPEYEEEEEVEEEDYDY